jgi:hypothetical protein
MPANTDGLDAGQVIGKPLVGYSQQVTTVLSD